MARGPSQRGPTQGGRSESRQPGATSTGTKRPTGRLPPAGRLSLSASLTPFLFEGTLTRTVEDAALALQVMAGPDSRDPFALTDTPDFVAALSRPVKGWRIAYSPDFDVFPVESGVAGGVAQGVRGFVGCGGGVGVH